MKHTLSDNLSWDSAFQVHNMYVVQEDLQPRMTIQTTTTLSSETTTPQVTTTPPPVAPTPAPVIPLLALVMTLSAFEQAYQNVLPLLTTKMSESAWTWTCWYSAGDFVKRWYASFCFLKHWYLIVWCTGWWNFYNTSTYSSCFSAVWCFHAFPLHHLSVGFDLCLDLLKSMKKNLLVWYHLACHVKHVCLYLHNADTPENTFNNVVVISKTCMPANITAHKQIYGKGRQLGRGLQVYQT